MKSKATSSLLLAASVAFLLFLQSGCWISTESNVGGPDAQVADGDAGDGETDTEAGDGHGDGAIEHEADMYGDGVCGNGIVDRGEECDDGNESNNDSCLNTCRNAYCGDCYVWYGVEPCDPCLDEWCLPDCAIDGCGDCILTIGEECDDCNLSNKDSCLNNCMVARCGDGFVWDGVEECDDGNLTDCDSCLNTCQYPYCGDCFVCPPEQCDTCLDEDCDWNCGVHFCGDCYVWLGAEECDDCNISNNDECLNTCVLPTCGDGFVWFGVEACDGDPPGTCTTPCGSAGVSECVGCGWVCIPPEDAACNGLDDDCDGGIDEHYVPYTCGAGECQASSTCIGGEENCVPAC
jgi:cysteine-rich repeat protein